MAQAASLVVRISADINDFSKKLNAMTRDVDRASKKVADVGRALTLGITLPAAVAAVGLAKMAAENEDVAGRMQRVFGNMAENVEGSIKQMMRSVPETQTDLEKMAISVDNMLQGMDLAPQRAAAMSESLLKLAGDASAFAHVPMGEALDALSKGVAGKTKGLLEFGIAIKEADIKQRAMQMGLLSAGNELTETGTALASYSLIMERSTRISGEAGRTAEQSGKQFAFLKRDLGELADNLSGFVLPGMSLAAKGARDLTNGIVGLPDGLKRFAMGATAVAAVLGPLTYAVIKSAQAYVTFKSAAALLTKTEGVVGFFAGLSNPIGQVVLAVGALTAAFVGLYEIYKRFIKAPDLTSALSVDPSLAKAIGGSGGTGVGGKNGVTQFNPKDPAGQLKERADLVASAFDSAIQHGTGVVSIYERINTLQRESAELMKAGPFTKEGQTAREVADQVQRIKDAIDLMSANGNVLGDIASRPFNVGAAGALSAVDSANSYRKDLATRSAASFFGTPFDPRQEAVIKSRDMVRGNENDLALREALVQLPDGFNAARQASIEFAESQRQTQHDVELAYERTKLSLTTFAGLSLQAGQMLGGLASKIGGGGLLAGIGGSAGGSFLSSFLAKGSSLIPFVGGLGSVAGAFIGKGLDSLFGHHKDASDNAANSLNSLAASAQKVGESLSNIPQGFKIASARFNSAAPGDFGNLGDGTIGGRVSGEFGSGAAGSGQGSSMTIHMHGPVFNGVADVAEFARQLGEHVEGQTRGGTTPLTLAFGV